MKHNGSNKSKWTKCIITATFFLSDTKLYEMVINVSECFKIFHIVFDMVERIENFSMCPDV